MKPTWCYNTGSETGKQEEAMEKEAFLEHLSSGLPVVGGSSAHQYMHRASQRALRITAQINTGSW